MKEEKQTVRCGRLPAAVICALFSLGLAWIFVPVFPSATLSVPAVAAVGAFSSIAVAFGLLSRWQRWFFPGCMAALTLTAVVEFRRLTGGVIVLYRDLLYGLCRVTGRIFVGPSDAGEAASPAFALLFLTVFAAAFIACTAAFCELRYSGWLLTAAAAGLLIGIIPVNAGICCIVGGTALTVICKNGGLKATSLPAASLFFPGFICLLAIAALIGGIGPFSAEALRDGARRKWRELTLHSHSYAMPEGSLSDLGPAEFSDLPALTVTVEQPQKLYLRGMIGETYTGTAWRSLTGEENADAAELFYWLHRDGFFADKILGAAYTADGMETTKRIIIENTGACRRYAYQPYAAANDAADDAGQIGDAKLYATDRAAESLYYEGSFREWYDLLARITEDQGETGSAVYLADENAYRDYVCAHYLDLPEETRETLSHVFDGSHLPQNLAETKKAVLEALDEYLFYDGSAAVYNGKNDFLSYVLQQNTGGYSVHYATAAALMLRYLGVPARYVEGYYISSETAASVSAGTPFVLTEKEAHAWAEYYLDGIGWLPFETTPGYLDEDDLLPYGAADAYQTDSFVTDELKQSAADDILQEKPKEIDQPKHGVSFRWEWLWWLLLLPPAVILTVVLRARISVWKRSRRLRGMPEREAVTQYYGDALRLIGLGATAPQEALEEAKSISDEALFSSHAVGREQLIKMRRFYEQTLVSGKREWRPLRRAYFYWIKGSY